MLVLMPGNETRREILFVKDRDPAQEHWTGRAAQRRRGAGADRHRHGAAEQPVRAVRRRRCSPAAAFGADRPTRRRRASSTRCRRAARRVALVLEPDARRQRSADAAARVRAADPRSLRRLRSRPTSRRSSTDLRIVKTPYERKVLVEEPRDLERRADGRHARGAAGRVRIRSEGRDRGGAPRPRRRLLGYPSIVGSGPNATILHYPDGERQMQAGDLLLVDAACNLDYMSGDITRTYPVSGTFSPAQKDIYRIVLQAQDEGIKAAQAGRHAPGHPPRTVEVIKAGLLKLGLITDASGEQYRMWYTHGASHYIGIDVHDVGDRSRPLEPGMAFTIEPGIYIRQSVLDALPRTPENIAFIEKVQPAVRKYADIGVRIEDSFLLEESGLRNLSARGAEDHRRDRGVAAPAAAIEAADTATARWLDTAAGVAVPRGCHRRALLRDRRRLARAAGAQFPLEGQPARPAPSTWSARCIC